MGQLCQDSEPLPKDWIESTWPNFLIYALYVCVCVCVCDVISQAFLYNMYV